MTNSQRLASVRDKLLSWITEQSVGAEAAGAAEIRSESILIRDGFYCGRRFDLGNHRAVWFLEENELKIYSKAGDLMAVFSTDKLTPPLSGESGQPQILRVPTPAPEQVQQSSDRRAA